MNPTVPSIPHFQHGTIQALRARHARQWSKRDYPRAIELLTKLTRQPEFRRSRPRPGAARPGTRERSGQLAHAKAEYEEYLRRYPEGSLGRTHPLSPSRTLERQPRAVATGRWGVSMMKSAGDSAAAHPSFTGREHSHWKLRNLDRSRRARTPSTRTETSSRGIAESASTSSRALPLALPKILCRRSWRPPRVIVRVRRAQ